MVHVKIGEFEGFNSINKYQLELNVGLQDTDAGGLRRGRGVIVKMIT